MKYLVLDTNVYLHFKNFEQIDWWKLLGEDEVTICVPHKVLAEIDKHKDQSRGKIQKRAKALSARLGEIFLQGAMPLVPMMDIPNPPATAFEDVRFHHEISDDWILLSVLHSNIDKKDIVVVAYDNGILLKAKQNGLGFFRMPDSFLLADEPSESEKELKRMSQKLAQYENRQPSPVIEFENETSLLCISQPDYLDIKGELEKYETELKESYPYQSLEEEPVANALNSLNQIINLTRSTSDQKVQYNKDLDVFFKNSCTLKELELGSKLMEQRFRKLEFWLSNTGTKSLGDTMVFLIFPQNVPVYNPKSRSIVQCDMPKKPVLQTAMSLNYPEVIRNFDATCNQTKKVELWDVDKSLEKKEFKYQSAHLLHNMRHKLDRKDDLYIDIAKCGNFSIRWIVYDSELIEPVSGKLNVVIK